jgi:Mn2+/Fe2+ NRAMP family transporter
MQMILSFELPFSLIPLLKFSSSGNKMGENKNSIYVSEEVVGFGSDMFWFIIHFLNKKRCWINNLCICIACRLLGSLGCSGL